LLSKDTINTDEIALRLDTSASPKYSVYEDAADIGGMGAAVSLSAFSADSIPLSIDVTSYPGVNKPEVIRLLVDAQTSGAYWLSVPNLDYLPSIYSVWLKDALSGDSVQLKTGVSYAFNIDKTNMATFGSNRFSLIITGKMVPPYQLQSFTATKATNVRQVQLAWTDVNEPTNTNFTVERSNDNGQTFNVLSVVTGTAAGQYSMLDKNPATGTNYYRLKQDVNNTIIYSGVLQVQYSEQNMTNINVYPNPAIGSISLAIITKTPANSVYNITITNSSGLIIKQASTAQTSWQAEVGNLRPGTYLVKVFNGKDNTYIGNTKFIKL
jgi:hypothetical protein